MGNGAEDVKWKMEDVKWNRLYSKSHISILNTQYSLLNTQYPIPKSHFRSLNLVKNNKAKTQSTKPTTPFRRSP